MPNRGAVAFFGYFGNFISRGEELSAGTLSPTLKPRRRTRFHRKKNERENDVSHVRSSRVLIGGLVNGVETND